MFSRYEDMKGSGDKLHKFLTLALDENMWQALLSSHFTHSIAWAGG
jgi:hypothetical protein